MSNETENSEMARSRNIKPGFFENETLGQLPSLTRLLFIGLWLIADREGRLEDRPLRIKAKILPYDACNVEKLLAQLAETGFIVRYTVEGEQFIAIPKFHKHQNPHLKEAASTLPAPDLHQISTGLTPEIPERTGLIPSSLIPDSLNLIPDSSNTGKPPNPNPSGPDLSKPETQNQSQNQNPQDLPPDSAAPPSHHLDVVKILLQNFDSSGVKAPKGKKNWATPRKHIAKFLNGNEDVDISWLS